MTQPEEKLVMQVTVTSEQDPELYAVLQGIQEPKRRANRFKALCIEGFRAQGGSLRVAGKAVDHQVPVAGGPGQPTTIREMLSWDDE